MLLLLRVLNTLTHLILTLIRQGKFIGQGSPVKKNKYDMICMCKSTHTQTHTEDMREKKRESRDRQRERESDGGRENVAF